MTSTIPRATPSPYTHAEALGGPAIRTFLRIAERWGLSAEEQQVLLGVPRATYYGWRKRPPERLGRGVLERISYIFGIYKALGILIPNASFRDRWIRQPNGNPLFGGHAPLERMLAGNTSDFYLVRQYLDDERGG